MKFDWKQTLGAVAPALATALGGPMAGVAVKTLSNQLLGRDAPQDEVEQAILTASPEDLAKLKEIDANFKRDMAKIGVDLEKLVIDDRKDARALAKVNMLPQIILSGLYTAGYIAVLWAFIDGDVSIQQSSKAEFNMVLGALTAAQMQIMNFFFGSSSGSKEKTAKL